MPLLYLAALWNDVVARMCGFMSLAFTVLGVYSTWLTGTIGVEHGKAYFWIGAAICFMLANFKIWASEHAKVVAGSPKLILTIEQINWEDGPKGNTVVLFAVNLLNAGAPTVTRSWGGDIQFGAGGVEEMKSFLLTGDWKLKNDEQIITLYPKDQIQAKTMEARLETGEGRNGRIFFNLQGSRIDQLKTANFIARIYCHDFLGNRFEGIFRPHGPVITVGGLYPHEEGGFVKPTPPESTSDTPELEPPTT
jgi:hypothetical protein